MNRWFAALAALLFAAAAQAQTTIRIIEFGAEPRAPLRYQYKPGKTQRSMMDMSMNISMEMDGQSMQGMQMPPIRNIAVTRVAEVFPDGSARIEFESERIEMQMGQLPPDPAAEQLGRALGGLSQMKGWQRVDASGRILESHLPLPEGMLESAGGQMAQSLMGDLGSGAEQLQQFPEEALGVGARWQVITDQFTDQLGMRMTEEFTLRARNGQRVELDVKAEQLLIPGAAMAEAGVVMNGDGQAGEGTMVIDLEGSMPAMTMSADTGTETIVPGQGGGLARVMRTRMQMRMSVGPAAE